MTLVDMLEVPSVADPELSPDGKQVLFSVNRADWKANNRISHVWRINTDGSGLVQMTNGPRGENGARWSPDGSRIAFLGRRGSASGAESEEAGSQIYLISNAGGEAQQLTKHATSVSSITWAPDGSTVYFTAANPKTAEEKERDKAKDDVYSFDENYKQVHLWKVAVSDEKESKITNGDYSINSYSLSRDGKRIAVSRGPSPLLGDRELSEVFVMNSSGGEMMQLTKNMIDEGNIQISPDDSQVLMTAGANRSWEPYYNSNLFVGPATGGEPRPVVPDFPYGIDAARWSKDGKSILMICNMGVHNEIFQLDLASKKYKQLTNADDAIGGGGPGGGMGSGTADDTLVFTLSTPELPGEIYILRPGQAEPARVTHVFDYIARDFQLPKAEKIQWKGKDGVAVEGVLTYPLDYHAGQALSLGRSSHGGPQASDKMSFSSWSGVSAGDGSQGLGYLATQLQGQRRATAMRSCGIWSATTMDQAHLDVLRRRRLSH